MNKEHDCLKYFSPIHSQHIISTLDRERAKNSSKNAKFELTDVIVALLHQVAS
jgi:hypothetical protein